MSPGCAPLHNVELLQSSVSDQCATIGLNMATRVPTLLPRVTHHGSMDLVTTTKNISTALLAKLF